MLDLVGNPNCWFCHAQAQILYDNQDRLALSQHKTDYNVIEQLELDTL